MGVRFLILEDDVTSRRFLEALIQRHFSEVRITSLTSVNEIYEKYGSPRRLGDHFDFIVTDIFLPGDATGIDLVMKIPEDMQKRTIICSSADRDKFLHLRRQRSLKCRFLHKPFDVARVQQTLRSLCNETGVRGTARFIPDQLETPGPVILITGCSSGVGEALAELLSTHESYRLVLTARERSLAKVTEKYRGSERVMTLPLDLSDDMQIERAVAKVMQHWGRIDILINNAGICYRGTVEQMDQKSESEQMKVNYMGPMALTRMVIPLMRERGRGKIINVSSVSGILGMPTMASYSASKHALEGASESMWYELKPMGIDVSVVRPGFINSDGYSHVLFPPKGRLSELLDGPYADFYRFMSPFVARLMRASLSTSESVARKVVRIIQTQNPPLWTDASPDASIFSWLRHLLPDRWFHRVVNGLFGLKVKWGQSYSHARRKAG